MYDICAVDVPRVVARHRDVFASDIEQALSHGNSRAHLAQHHCRRQRTPRLENLRRLRQRVDWDCTSAIRGRRIRHRPEGHGVCARFDHDRSVLNTISVGTLSATKRRGKTSHADRLTWQHPVFHTYFHGQNARCESFRRPADRTRRLLCHGSWVCRLCSPSPLRSTQSVLHHTGQTQHGLRARVIDTRRQVNRIAQRSDDPASRREDIVGLSRHTASGQLLRHRQRQTVRVHNESSQTASTNHRPALQGKMACRVVLQVDQAEPSPQSFLRQLDQRTQDAGLDRHQRVRARSHTPQAVGPQTRSHRNPANSQRDTFRENPYFHGTYGHADDRIH